MDLNLSNTLLPGDPRLIDHIVGQVKSQGIFDQFRKECIADVDTKPAYQNLRTRVESSVNSFLAKQNWKPDQNKNQLRETLRKHIHDAPYLDTGVERIVDQVVNPKTYNVFMPQIEDLVYKYLGIERPKPKEKNGPCSLKDLLPKDLDPVSPVSDRNSLKDISMESMEEDSQSNLETANGDDRRTPPLIDRIKIEKEEVEIKQETVEEIKTETPKPEMTKPEATKQEVSKPEIKIEKDETEELKPTVQPEVVKTEEKVEDEEEDSPVFEPIDIMNLNESNISNDSHLSGISELTSHRSKSPDFDFGRDNFDASNQDSQLSKVSSDSRLSIVTDFGSSNQGSNFNTEEKKEKTVWNFDLESVKSKDSSQDSEGKANKMTTDNIKVEKVEKEKSSSKDDSRSKSSKDKERSSSKDSRSHREREKDRDKDRKRHRSSDKKHRSKDKVEDSKRESSGKSEKNDKEKKDSKDGKDLKDIYKEKIRELREKKEMTEKEKLNKVSSEKRDGSKDKKSSTSSSRSSSSSKSKESRSERDKEKDKDRSKESKDKSRRSDSDSRKSSRDEKKRRDSDRTKSSERSEKNEDKKVEDKNKDKSSRDKKRKDDKKRSKDDHSSMRKSSSDRRSTDRDGANGSNSKNTHKSSSSNVSVTKSSSSSVNKSDSGTSQCSSDPSDSIKNVQPSSSKPVQKQTEGDKVSESETCDKSQNPALPLKKRPLQTESPTTEGSSAKKQKLSSEPEAKKSTQKSESEKLEREVEKKDVRCLPDYERVQIIEVPVEYDDLDTSEEQTPWDMENTPTDFLRRDAPFQPNQLRSFIINDDPEPSQNWNIRKSPAIESHAISKEQETKENEDNEPKESPSGDKITREFSINIQRLPEETTTKELKRKKGRPPKDKSEKNKIVEEEKEVDDSLDSLEFSEPSDEPPQKKRGKRGRPKKNRDEGASSSTLPNGDNISAPLSPESDVSNADKQTTKEDKSRQRSKQHYTSDDLYKPRLSSSLSRRNRRTNPA